MKTKVYYGDCGHKIGGLEHKKVVLDNVVHCDECDDTVEITKIVTEEVKTKRKKTDPLNDRCPTCDGDNTEGEENVDIGGQAEGDVWFDRWCMDCEAKWCEMYKARFEKWEYR